MNGAIANVMDVLALVKKAPRTRRELSEVTGMPTEQIGTYLKAAEGEGIVVSEAGPPLSKGVRGFPARVYRWAS